MGAEMNMTYESFVRRAFGFNDQVIERWGDPAMLANTDIFSDGDINEVKAGIAYSICIFNSAVTEIEGSNLTRELVGKMHGFLAEVIAAPTKLDVFKIINRYVAEIENPYLRNE